MFSYSIEDPEGRKKAHQLERLKYYYAVWETDSVETADTIYKELDGQEYGETGVRVDLRFIPDEIEFDEPIRVNKQDGDRPDVATEGRFSQVFIERVKNIIENRNKGPGELCSSRVCHISFDQIEG